MLSSGRSASLPVENVCHTEEPTCPSRRPRITVVDPATEQEIGSYAEHGPEQIEAALAAADAAFREWRRRPSSERGGAADARSPASCASAPRSSPSSSRARWASRSPSPRFEVEKCASACEHFAEVGPAMLAEQTIDAGAGTQHRRLRADRRRSSPSCRGTSRSGRSSASPRRRCWPATPRCSSTRRTSRARRSRCEEVFAAAGAPDGPVHEPDRRRRERPGRVGQADRRPARRRGHADRLRARGRLRRRRGRPGAEEERAGARRLGPVRRARRRRPRRHGRARRQGPPDERGPDVHRAQALPGRRDDRRRVRDAAGARRSRRS